MLGNFLFWREGGSLRLLRFISVCDVSFCHPASPLPASTTLSNICQHHQVPLHQVPRMLFQVLSQFLLCLLLLHQVCCLHQTFYQVIPCWCLLLPKNPILCMPTSHSPATATKRVEVKIPTCKLASVCKDALQSISLYCILLLARREEDSGKGI